MKPMTPNQIAAYRETTIRHGNASTIVRSRYCDGCKRQRSVAQFDDGFEKCKVCRGVK